MKFLSEFRKWLDGEDAITTSVEPQELSEWDEFFVKIAREVETVMKREMFTPPGGPTYLPGEYIIFLSKDDNTLWQGRKREGLEEGLRNTLSQRARDLVGNKVLKNDKIALSLGVDGALAKGQVRVQAVWDDDSPRTQITARKKKPEPAVPADDITEVGIEQGDQTVIRPRSPLFVLNYTREGQGPVSFKSFKNRIVIGRGSKDFPVDVILDGDQEISRKQVSVEMLESGLFKIECVGRNAIEVEGKEVTPGAHAEIKAGEAFKVGVYELRVTER